jgi:hypothetical protein
MDVILIIYTSLIAVCLMGIAYCQMIIWRNERVYLYRRRLIDRIYKLSQADIASGKDHDYWRWDVYETVSYDAMLYQFWRPLDSFYRDKTFLK